MLNLSERWRGVKGYEDYYQVSDKGRIKSKDRSVFNGRVWYTKKGKVLKPTKTSTGYWKIELKSDGVKKSYKVHRLVAFAFISKPDGKDLINHIDGNPLNNHFMNLEWCTQSENMKHAYETGLVLSSNFHKFKDEILQKYKDDESVTIRGLSKEYKCSSKTIRNHLKINGVEIRGPGHTQNIYKINRKKLIAYFEMGLKNKDIAEILGTNRHLIGVYRYKHKKGELII